MACGEKDKSLDSINNTYWENLFTEKSAAGNNIDSIIRTTAKSYAFISSKKFLYDEVVYIDTVFHDSKYQSTTHRDTLSTSPDSGIWVYYKPEVTFIQEKGNILGDSTLIYTGIVRDEETLDVYFTSSRTLTLHLK